MENGVSVPSNVWANNEAETYPSGPTEPVEEMDEATIAAKVEVFQKAPDPHVTANEIVINFFDIGRLRSFPHTKDVVVVVDGSKSIGDWHFERGRRALQNMMELEGESKNDTRYAAVTFSDTASVKFQFLPCTESANEIMKIPFDNGNTNTQAGLTEAKKLFDDPISGHRVNAKKVVLLVTDGHANVEQDLVIPQANALKKSGVKIYVVAVGEKMDGLEEMVKVASEPKEKYLYRVKSFTGFLQIVQLATKQVSSIQSNIKSLETKITECIENEQNALAERETLQEAVKNANALESSPFEKDNRIKELESQASSTESNIKSLEAKITECIENEQNALVEYKTLEEAAKKENALESSLREKDNRIKELENEVSSIQSNIKSLETKITECTENERKALAECQTLQEAVKNAKALECSFREKDHRMKELENEVSSIQSNIKSLESKITECTENEQKALAECKTLQEAVKNENALECSLREKDNHIKELESEVSSIQSNIKSLEAKITECTENEQKALAECKALQEAVKDESSLREKDSHIKELESEVSSIKSNIKSLETKITECTENERKALAECKTLQEAVKNANALESSLGEKYNHIKELESKVSSIQSKIKSLETKITECTENEQKALAECKNLQEDVKSANALESSLREKDNHIKELESEVSSLQSNIKSLGAKITECTENEQKALAECKTLQEAVKNENALEFSLRGKENRIEELENEVSSLQFNIKSLEGKITKCTENEQKALAECKTLQEAVKNANALESSLREKDNHIKELESEIKRIEGRIDDKNKELVTKYKKEMALRKKLHNKLVELKGNIRVYCRVRPVIKEDGDGKNALNVITFDEDDDAILKVEKSKGEYKPFAFDKVFRPESTQEQVFEEVKSLVVSCIDGYNVCIFAYGQTGSGKTFTMEGPPSNPGINQRALDSLFEKTRDRDDDWQFSINVSVIEIYNEMVLDLLSDDPTKKLDIRKGVDGPFVPDLTETEVNNIDELNELFSTGKDNRKTAETKMNEISSRSHAILCVKVNGVNQTTRDRTRGTLNLVDLAGSERVSKSGIDGAQMKEAQYINKSLSALGNVIESLMKKKTHIPYRDSKLTYLLQESLGGDSKTLMVVQVAPVEKNLSETLCSLNFAQRVKAVERGQATKQITHVRRRLFPED